MAAIDDLIAQIDDPALRERLAREVAELQRTRKFGLVFEQHLPELLPLPSAGLQRPRDSERYRASYHARTTGRGLCAACASTVIFLLWHIDAWFEVGGHIAEEYDWGLPDQRI